MKCRLSLSSMNSGFFLSAIVIMGVASARGDDTERLLGTIKNELASIQQVVASDLTQVKDLRGAEANLKKLLEATEKYLGEIDAEENTGHPLVIAHSKIMAAMKSIEARLPHETSELGNTRLSPLPVPVFSDHKVVGKASNELNQAQQKLAEHLRTSPNDAAGAEKLLTAVILAQENLAWEVGWPFDAKEAATVKKAGQLTPEVYVSRLNRGVQQINEHLTNELRSVGRESSGLAFSIFSPLSPEHQKQIEESLVKQRGAAAKDAWTKGTKSFDPKAFGRAGR